MGSRNPVTKRLLLYRNGDPSFRPLPYMYNTKHVKSFEKLLDECEEKVSTVNGGGVRALYSTDGETKLTTVKQIEGFDDEKVVCVGPDGFKPVKDGYESIALRKNTKAPPAADSENFREKNKKLYGDVPSPRPEDRTVQGRRIMVMRSGDPDFKPKRYVWRERHIKTWDKFLEELKELVIPLDGGNIMYMYTKDGDEVTTFDQLQNNETYVVAGVDGWEDPFREEEDFGGAFDSEPPPPSSNKKSKKPAPKPKNNNFDRSRDPSPAPVSREPSAVSMNPDGTPKTPRPRTAAEDRVYNRKDQIKPDTIHLFIFRNGNGLEASRQSFTAKQLDRGMPFVLENIAKRYGINPKQLCAMDSRPVKTVAELESKGAYIIIPLGEQFRDTWYYLPDGALDTSEDAQRERMEEEGEEPPPRSEDGERKKLRSRARRRPDSVASVDSRVEADRSMNDDDKVTIKLNDGDAFSLYEDLEPPPEEDYDEDYEEEPEPEEFEEDYGPEDGGGREHHHHHHHHYGDREQEQKYEEDDRDYDYDERDRDRHRHHHHHRPPTAHSMESNCSHCEALERRLVRHHRTAHGPRDGRPAPVKAKHDFPANRSYDGRRDKRREYDRATVHRSHSESDFRRKPRPPSEESVEEPPRRSRESRPRASSTDPKTKPKPKEPKPKPRTKSSSVNKGKSGNWKGARDPGPWKK